MEKISFDKIEQIWSENTHPVQIYVHSAFCKSICKYCVYRGELYEKNKYDKYFNEYLPGQIDRYSNIISRQTVNSIYFGGGTPNTEEDLANLKPTFDRLRHVPCREKIIELHVGLPITDKTIQVLAEEKFNTVILCQQTFDKEKLKEENRVDIANNNLDEIIGKLHAAGMNVGIDFIIFPDNPDRIIDDMKIISSYKNLSDEITLAPLYQNKDYTKLLEIFEYMRSFGYIFANHIDSLEKAMNKRCWRLVLGNKQADYLDTLYSFIPYLSETGSSYDSTYTNSLGIGATTHMVKQTYSRVNNNIYYESWDGENTSYTLKVITPYKELLIKRILDIADKLPEVVPDGTQFNFKVYRPGDSNRHICESDTQVDLTMSLPKCKVKHLKNEAEQFYNAILKIEQ